MLIENDCVAVLLSLCDLDAGAIDDEPNYTIIDLCVRLLEVVTRSQG